jgi:hypothetical protein
VLVRQWCEIASRVLVELFLELVKPGGAGHSMPSKVPRDPGRRDRSKYILLTTQVNQK